MWKKPTIYLHWLVAFVIAFAVIIVKVSNDLNAEDALPFLRAHAALGIVIGLLTLLRIYYKIKHKDTNPKSTKIGTIVHMGLYGFLLLMFFSGLALGFSGMFSYFLDGTIPSGLSNIAGIHSLVASILIPLIGLHIVAALVYVFKKGDYTFSRMIGINKRTVKKD